MPQLAHVLDTLEAFHGIQQPAAPTDPYLFLLWLHCGYPASDESCAKGWEALNKQLGTDPLRLLSADPTQLARAIKPGGLMPELRAARLQETAERVHKEFGGDLHGALSRLSIAQARKALEKFPGIAGPGADRILLFGGFSPVAAVPSNCPHVAVRIRRGREDQNYRKTYNEAQQILSAGTPETFDGRIRAYLLLKHHGQRLCKRSNPKCGTCPLASFCAYSLGTRPTSEE